MEDRLAKLEIIQKRLARRSRKTATALITPFPISNAVVGPDVKGPILRYLFPCDGVITKGIVQFREKPKGEVSIDVKLFSELMSAGKGFALSKRMTKMEPNLKVTAGDCLEVILSTPEEHPVTEIWIAFLWSPSVRDVEAKSFLIDELDKLSAEID